MTEQTTVPPPVPDDAAPAGVAPTEEEPTGRLARLARLQARRDKAGDAVGRLKMPKLDRSYVIVEGTDTDDLRKGPGHYPKTPLPGEGGTVGVDDLVAAGAVRAGAPVKILGSGEIDVALHVSADAFSATAKEKITAAGGSVTEL